MSEWFDNDREKEAASGSNEGEILTSTRWHQFGTVYVAVDGVQTALSGYTYNQYCPIYAEGSRAITGCSNTADAQILYYWIEKGYDLSLEVTTENYFKIKNDSSTYYVSDTANADEGTLSQINAILGSPDRIGNGDFIAALNFFCGVNNHSSYGASTSTSWSYSVSYTGKNTAAFVAAGFDSHYFIARKASGSVPGLFFTGDTGFNEVGLSILRENLDYGDPIRVGIPGHAVYMDGYRLNSETGEYEYHLNYGYGPRSSSTRWYTVSEMEAATIGYFAIDLSPDVKVLVSNAREDYCGGSFLRGLERINHIVNDKSTTFDFDAGLAGETIVLDAVARIASNVDVAFRNVAVSLATTGAGLFESARGMSFDISGGSLIVNSTGTTCAIRETGNAAVNVTIENGFIYTGNAEGGISTIQKVLLADGDYSFGDFDADFYASVGGYAVRSGSAADTVTLERGAALFGTLDLGAGDNTLNIGAGSLFYGAFAGAADTLTVNLTIDAAERSGATVALADDASLEAFRTATGGVLNVDFGALGTETGSYDLLYYVGFDPVRMFAVNLTVEGETATLDEAHREYGAFTLVDDGEKLVLEYAPPQFPQNPVATPERQSWDPTDAAQYFVEYSTDDFAHAFAVGTAGAALDTPKLPVGTYSWRVKADDCDTWAQGDNIVSEIAAGPRVVRSEANGDGDLFFSEPDGVWDCSCRAVHRGSLGDWDGTGEAAAVAGKWRFGSFFFGSNDPNILLLTDDANGDALFIDDIYTELPAELAENRSRLAGIDEIRTGAGDDLVDMTSRRFEYTGNGLTIRGGAGDDTIWANRDDNLLFGDAGNDRLVGASGNDVLAGGSGNDAMHGGGGDDLFVFCANWGVDTVEQLADGSVTLWFAVGDAAHWDAATSTYADGENSVTVAGVENVTLKFGDDGSRRYAALAAAGAFAEFSSERIFETPGKGVLAVL